MSPRFRLITLVYLDLLFALFAGVNLLNLALAVTQGRTPHRLERDFLIVAVYWTADAQLGDPLDKKNPLSRVRLVSAARRELRWDFIQPATARQPMPGRRASAPCTVFVKAPAPPGAWRLQTEHWRLVERVEYRTRRGAQTFVRRGGRLNLVIETEGGR